MEPVLKTKIDRILSKKIQKGLNYLDLPFGLALASKAKIPSMNNFMFSKCQCGKSSVGFFMSSFDFYTGLCSIGDTLIWVQTRGGVIITGVLHSAGTEKEQ